MENTKINLEQALEQIGLSKRESLVYLCLLKNGPLSPTNLASKTGIKRPNVYDSLKSLENKGLIHYQLKNKRKLIVASSPQNLFEISQQKFELAKKVLPVLQSLDREKSFQSNITYYQGRKAMRELFSDYPKAKSKEVFALISPEDLNNMIGKDFTQSLVNERVKRGCRVRTLRPIEKEFKYDAYLTPEGRRLTEVAFIPSKYMFSLSLVMYDNKVIFFSSKHEGFGFMVESKELTETMRMFYDNLWENSGKVNMEQY
jgi:HTH-type transcriptional regulator, sugar sensing transcriptional regulator